MFLFFSKIRHFAFKAILFPDGWGVCDDSLIFISSEFDHSESVYNKRPMDHIVHLIAETLNPNYSHDLSATNMNAW